MDKKLYRSKTDRRIAGVCGGLGNYFDIDPTIIRLAWVVALFFAGGGHYILKLYTLLSECSLRLPFGSLLLGSPTLHACAVYYCVLLSLCLLGPPKANARETSPCLFTTR